MPRQPFDAPENLLKEGPGQVALGELQGEVPGVPDQPPARLEEPLRQTRERPVLDRHRQHEPTEQVPRL
jgi:hypothetical protein